MRTAEFCDYNSGQIVAADLFVHESFEGQPVLQTRRRSDPSQEHATSDKGPHRPEKRGLTK